MKKSEILFLALALVNVGKVIGQASVATNNYLTIDGRIVDTKKLVKQN
jgi:hypothetical protein